MQKKYTSLGLMSGTSGDGVDASLINSNGIDHFDVVKDKYFEYDSHIFKEFHSIKEKINNLNDFNKYEKELQKLERDITFFNAKIIKELNIKETNLLVGFHGQTVYHNPELKISKQLGDGRLLHQLTKKKVVFNFREKDILNGGEGAPLTPIFHQLITLQKKIELPICILNIGGISNITIIKKNVGTSGIFSKDIGPGNCLIDFWVRKNSNKKFDQDGILASNGKTNEVILEQALDLYNNRLNKKKSSFDTNDFDISFSRGLSLEDGTATLTDFSASIIAEVLSSILHKEKKIKDILICGGGRKNKILLKRIQQNLNPKVKIKLLDEYDLDGDFIESQAFAFLAIRTLKKLPITFPSTTNCKSPTIGGDVVGN